MRAMNNYLWGRRTAALLLAAGLILTSACSKDSEETSTTTETSAQETTTEETTAAETTAEETTEETTTETTSEATTAAPAFVLPFSGKAVDDEELLHRRPLAVMMDNHPDARPQAGLTEADLVYEIKVEGTYTRYMLVFQSEDLPRVGPIRSSREYYLDEMQGLQALYLHVGGAAPALERIADEGYETLDFVGMERDSSRGKVAPHNVYSQQTLMEAAAERRGFDLTVEDVRAYSYNTEAKVPAGGQAAEEVEVEFWPDNISLFTYDEETGAYTLAKDANPIIDQNTDETFPITNIIIREAESRPIGNTWLDIDVVGEGAGWYVTQGKAVEITWSKESVDELARYYDADGNELQLNPGKTWIEVVDPGDPVTFSPAD